MYYERNSLSYRKCIPITRQSMVCVHLTNWSIIRKKCRKFVKTLLLKRNAKCAIRWVNAVLFALCVKVFEYFFNTVVVKGPLEWSKNLKNFDVCLLSSKARLPTSNKTFEMVLSWIPELCCLSSFSV